ncbi:UDP-N-acetylmuramate dehydrogenase [Antricoccus suffuscus]|uniref:UDP-N-acetylenolpyruvoylglucosamine reductase n=1 Tax=Antricoccus suffuscus TaxID=1629062 RepID=A0A2T0YZD6_9ACTN|nr:UDP-N-acetylmuramate dehydrogenase [Antricoccus suffuscus]PRZ29268.1 UDP-N-acetylmuramate dehydrogenase [Antricoccus suffuscus]
MIEVKPEPVRLRDFTTMRVGGPAQMTYADDAEALINAVAAADNAGSPVLLVGGGSNLVIADAGWAGTTIRIGLRGIAAEHDDDTVLVDVAAGEPWDDFVAQCVDNGWSGVECLSGIPGLTGATPIQNVGAYGAETADVLVNVDVWDRQGFDVGVLAARSCEFAYRTSVFKGSSRYVVLGVRLALVRSPLSAPIRYAELARTLGVEVGDRAPLKAVREAVLSLRSGKGMVLDVDDHDTWSAGSFFTNPIIEAHRVPEHAPSWPSGDLVKTSAAWLIEHAGFVKGFGNERAALSTKHTLALTNRGGAATEDILALARTIRDGVLLEFGIELRPEPLLIGCAL